MNIVVYDADCALCSRVRSAVEALDWLRTLRWVDSQSSQARALGIPPELLQRSVYLVSASRRLSGFEAVQYIVSRLPLVWLAGAWMIAAKPRAALGLAFFLSPLARPLGQPAYEWVARNRYRLPGSTCDNRIK